MPTDTDDLIIAKRRLILRDSLAFLTLMALTIVLFAVTLLLFRSFTGHRADLATRWSARGREALQSGKPQDAIFDLRTALTYAPGTRPYEQLLAEALGQAGHTDESYNYFMGLWATEPGDGFTNLELARLAVKRHDRQAAVKFYRAAIYGTWEGDGVARRGEVRLELARYLIAMHDLSVARTELLITAGNIPDSYASDMTVGQLLEQVNDPTNALVYYRKAIAAKPDDPDALAAAGRIDYNVGDYQNAHRLLARAQAERASQHLPAPSADDITLMNNAERLLQLMPLHYLPSRVRVGRILADRAIARKRLADCTAQFPPSIPPPAPLQALTANWASPDATADARDLLRDSDLQDSTMQLVYDTETATDKVCTAPTGDDALLLTLANARQINPPSETDSSAPGVVQHP